MLNSTSLKRYRTEPTPAVMFVPVPEISVHRRQWRTLRFFFFLTSPGNSHGPADRGCPEHAGAGLYGEELGSAACWLMSFIPPPEQPRGGDGGDPSSSRVSGPLPWPVLKVKAKSAFSRCKGDSLAQERCPVTAFPQRVLFLLSWGPQMFRCVHDCALGIFES